MATLGSVLDDFDHVRITFESHWSVFKNIHFPAEFNDFMQLLGHLEATLRPIFVKIVEDKGRKVKNGPPKGHVDVEWHV